MTIQLSFPTKKLGDFIIRVNTRVKDASYDPKLLTVYGVTNKEGVTITGNQASENLSNYILLKGNQFAYNPYRINVGSIGIMPKGTLGVVSPAYVVFETTPELDSKFLLFYLKSPLGINLIKWYGDRGGVRSALRYDDLSEIDIPALTIEQQKTVMKSFLNIKEKLDTLNNELNHQQVNLAMLREAILQDAIQGKLVEQNYDDEPASELLKKIREEKERLIKERKIKKEKPLPPITEDEVPSELPKGWECVRLDEISEKVTDGTHKTPNYLDEGIKFISAKDIKGDKLSFSNCKYISVEEYEQINYRCKIKIDTILVSKSGSIGEVVVVNTEEKFGIFESLAVVNLLNHMNVHYIKYCCKYFIKKMNNQLIKGTGVKHLHLNMLKKILIPIPPLNEQRRIVKKVDQLIAFCDELEDIMEYSKQYSEMLMVSVLQEAFSR